MVALRGRSEHGWGTRCVGKVMGGEGWMGTRQHSDGSVSFPSVSWRRVLVLGGAARGRRLLWGSKGGQGAGDVQGMGRRGSWLRALIVLVLGPVLQDAGELHVVEVALFVDGRLPVHLIHLLVSEPVPHGGQQLTQVVLVDEACKEGGGQR